MTNIVIKTNIFRKNASYVMLIVFLKMINDQFNYFKYFISNLETNF